nr:hypothetical protein 6 [Legionellales bacterium]
MKERREDWDLEGLAVKVMHKDQKGLEIALKRFRRKVKDSKLFVELEKHEYYRKPSEIRRTKRLHARLRYQYQQNT